MLVEKKIYSEFILPTFQWVHLQELKNSETLKFEENNETQICELLLKNNYKDRRKSFLDINIIIFCSCASKLAAKGQFIFDKKNKTWAVEIAERKKHIFESE